MKNRTGGNFLARKSDVTKSLKSEPTVRHVLVIEDEATDADRLKATLHLMFGYEIEVRHVKTLGAGLDAVIERRPELVLLDDYLRPSDTAAQTIPFLRRCGYDGPIVVISGAVDRQRRSTLMKAGAADVIHKDDLDSARLGEALAHVRASLAK